MRATRTARFLRKCCPPVHRLERGIDIRVSLRLSLLRIGSDADEHIGREQYRGSAHKNNYAERKYSFHGINLLRPANGLHNNYISAPSTAYPEAL